MGHLSAERGRHEQPGGSLRIGGEPGVKVTCLQRSLPVQRLALTGRGSKARRRCARMCCKRRLARQMVKGVAAQELPVQRELLWPQQRAA